ncbi:hypothetical protein BH09ACT12_BH09ACT12_03960 [soil metagenome]
MSAEPESHHVGPRTFSHKVNVPKPCALSERGASAVEYGLLLAGIAGVFVMVILLLGGQVHDLFGGTCAEVDRMSESSTC